MSDYNPTIDDWIKEGGKSARLVVFDDTGAIIHTTAMVFIQSLPPGMYHATLTVEGESDLLLINTHSMLVEQRNSDSNPFYRKVTDFPEGWEPYNNDDAMNLPPGEYCGTTQGLYRRKS